MNVKLIAHYRYYGVTWNFRKTTTFLHNVQQFLFKAVNRRGCRRAYKMLKYYPSAKPKTYYCLYWSECYYEEPYAGKPHVRICERLRLRGLSLLDFRTVTLFQIIWLAYKYFIWQIMHWEHFSKKEKKRKLLAFWRVLFTTLMEDWIVIRNSRKLIPTTSLIN